MIKADCRKVFKEKRKLLSNNERQTLSTQILNRLLENYDFNNKTVSIFLPIERTLEINTWPFLKLKQTHNVRFGVPIVRSETITIDHYEFEGMEQLLISDYGIPEPKGGILIQPEEFDIIIVPLLCFDKKGFRVGYGKGYYDHFLATCKKETLFIGISYFDAIDEIEDVFHEDVPLTACITPSKRYAF